jgi:cyclophilin family peptidyl-prolyl cis-trans isomerase
MLAVCALTIAPRMAHAVNTLVSFNTTFGSIQVDLFGEVTPQTVNNFLAYVNGGYYQDTIVHRAITLANGQRFIIQGGGFKTADFTANPRPLEPTSLAAMSGFPSPINEPKISNLRGTIAMAKVPNLPNSATSQWFFNLSNDNIKAVLGDVDPPVGGPDLDNQNGGFTAFGWVIGNGLSVADTIHDLSRTTEVFDPDDPNDPNDPVVAFAGVPKNGNSFVSLNSVTIVETHPAFQHPTSAVDVNNNGELSALDAQIIINRILTHGSHNPVNSVGSTYAYIDTSGNNLASPLDVQIVVNAVLLHGSGVPAPQDASPLALQAEAALAAPLTIVPEPASLALGIVAVLALAGGALARRRRG